MDRQELFIDIIMWLAGTLSVIGILLTLTLIFAMEGKKPRCHNCKFGGNQFKVGKLTQLVTNTNLNRRSNKYSMKIYKCNSCEADTKELSAESWIEMGGKGNTFFFVQFYQGDTVQVKSNYDHLHFCSPSCFTSFFQVEHPKPADH